MYAQGRTREQIKVHTVMGWLISLPTLTRRCESGAGVGQSTQHFGGGGRAHGDGNVRGLRDRLPRTALPQCQLNVRNSKETPLYECLICHFCFGDQVLPSLRRRRQGTPLRAVAV